MDIQKQEIKEAVELPLVQGDLYEKVGGHRAATHRSGVSQAGKTCRVQCAARRRAESRSTSRGLCQPGMSPPPPPPPPTDRH